MARDDKCEPLALTGRRPKLKVDQRLSVVPFVAAIAFGLFIGIRQSSDPQTRHTVFFFTQQAIMMHPMIENPNVKIAITRNNRSSAISAHP